MKKKPDFTLISILAFCLLSGVSIEPKAIFTKSDKQNIVIKDTILYSKEELWRKVLINQYLMSRQNDSILFFSDSLELSQYQISSVEDSFENIYIIGVSYNDGKQLESFMNANKSGGSIRKETGFKSTLLIRQSGGLYWLVFGFCAQRELDDITWKYRRELVQYMNINK